MESDDSLYLKDNLAGECPSSHLGENQILYQNPQREYGALWFSTTGNDRTQTLSDLSSTKLLWPSEITSENTTASAPPDKLALPLLNPSSPLTPSSYLKRPLTDRDRKCIYEYSIKNPTAKQREIGGTFYYISIVE